MRFDERKTQEYYANREKLHALKLDAWAWLQAHDPQTAAVLEESKRVFKHRVRSIQAADGRILYCNSLKWVKGLKDEHSDD